ncbi:MAG: HD domain-containing phosphohydrolase [bacterium]
MSKILIVDDNLTALKEIVERFKEKGYEIEGVDNKEEAIDIIKKSPAFDVVVVDMKLREGDEKGGMEVAKAVREKDTLTEIIVLTAHGDYEKVCEAMKLLRLWGYINRNMDDANQTLDVEVEKALTYVGIQREQVTFKKGFIECLKVAIDSSDPYLHGHSQRVVNYSKKIGIKWNKTYPEEKVDIDKLEIASAVHDIGKIGINQSVLHKPIGLSNADWGMIEVHPEEGFRILNTPSELPPIAHIVREHHEWYNPPEGIQDRRPRPYPGKVTGDNISIEARIIAVADAFDALTSKRPYHEAKTKQDALSMIKGDKNNPDSKYFGCHDPRIVDLLEDEVFK